MRAIIVCVDYADLLAITLPYNRHHFSEVCVVTSLTDAATLKVIEQHATHIHPTDAFYRDGAVFNKWAALEEALDSFGRYGWLCLMDADVMWPKVLPQFSREVGYLYTPRRRMHVAFKGDVPAEADWVIRFPLHRQEVEFAGYSQIFHASDPVLGPAPWHEVNWRHAGGADSFFQQKWSSDHKIRPPFEVLHLGEAGVNWCGRATAYTDGTQHPEAAQRRQQVRDFIRSRVQGPQRFDREKL